MRSRAVWMVAIGAMAVAVAFYLLIGNTDSTSGGKGAGGREIRFPVEVVPVEARRVEYSVTAVGSVEAFEVVQVTARVPGIVERVHFAEGDVVETGKMLVEIEPERYRITVQSARATMEKAEASKAEAEAGLARREGVDRQNPGLIPGEEMERWRTMVRAATAEASQARAALEMAELNLRDALLRAPVPGAIQTRTVQTGQYVQPGTVLATLVRREPLLLRFQIPEQEAPHLRAGMCARFTVGESDREFSAEIVHVAEGADVSSRMVAVTAEVDDPERKALRPGSFAQVRVPVSATAAAPVIPQMSVRPSERGFLVYIVEDSLARERVLRLGMRTADGRVEVRTGVNPGENLVVRGAEALFDGAAVRISDQKQEAEP